jgi:selT/selW/selH-like putative selenoprotein
VKGANGIFDVTVDGKLLFSKNRDRGFPAQDEVVKAIRSLAAPRS